jgi:hypothetical protein
MSERKMRRVILAEPCGNGGTRYRYTLECGHELDWVATPRNRRPARKRCRECEWIDGFRARNPEIWGQLLHQLEAVPMDDRAAALTRWVHHVCAAESMALKMAKSGEDVLLCFELTRPDYRYQLRGWFGDDQDEAIAR